MNFFETGSWDEKLTTATTRDGTWQSIWQKRQQDHMEVERSITYASGWGQDWNDFSRLTSQSLGGHEVRSAQQWLTLFYICEVGWLVYVPLRIGGQG